MLSGTTIGSYVLGPKIGQGAFGEIYVVRNPHDGSMLALKIETLSSRRNVLEIETNVLKRLSPSPYFPKFIQSGRNSYYLWLTMELLGPSLSQVLKRLPLNRFSLSTGLRVADSILCGLESMHKKGFIHRDIKPSNVLLRRNRTYPIAIIDFGLARVYIDRKTERHLPARSHPGFRGTSVYASPNAHMHQELSRRDDLISWFYMILDIMAGPLPWKKLENKAEILHMKRITSITTMADSISHQLSEIWDHIENLGYSDTPNYSLMHNLLAQACEQNHIKQSDEWDWHPNILQMDKSNDIFDPQRNDEGSSNESNGSDKFSTFSRVKKGLESQPLLGDDNEEPCCCCLI